MRSISRNGIVNGKDALQLAHPNGTLVDVSDLEGIYPSPTRLSITFFFNNMKINIAWKVFGKVSSSCVLSPLIHRIENTLFLIYLSNFLVHRVRCICCVARRSSTQRHSEVMCRTTSTNVEATRTSSLHY